MDPDARRRARQSRDHPDRRSATIKPSLDKIALALSSRRDNHHLAATAKMAILIVAAFPSRLSRYSPHQVPRQFHRAAPIKRALPRLSICRSATFGEAGNPSASSAEKCRHGSESRLIGVSVRWRLAVEFERARDPSREQSTGLSFAAGHSTTNFRPKTGAWALFVNGLSLTSEPWVELEGRTADLSRPSPIRDKKALA